MFTINNLALNWESAFNFLHLLDPVSTTHTFQTFPETADAKKLAASGKGPKPWQFLNKRLVDAWNDIEQANQQGFTVSSAVNELVAGHSRSGTDIKTVRAVWLDDDGNGVAVEALPLSPSITVETSPGRYHHYWLADGWSALGEGRTDFDMVMRSMVDLYGGAPNTASLGQTLRLPGTWNHRFGENEPFLVDVKAPMDGHLVRYNREQITSAFGSGLEKVLVME